MDSVRLGSYSALSPEPWLCPGGAISHLRKLHNVNISVVTLFILSRTPILSNILCPRPLYNVELLTENGAVFKAVQNTFNIKWCRLPVALELQY